MKRFLFALIFLVSCTSSKRSLDEYMKDNGKVKVLASTEMIQDVVKRVGGSYVDTSVLIKSGIDPHSYELVKGDEEKIDRADLLFYNGLGLEHGLSLQQCLKSHPYALAVGSYVQKKYPDKILYKSGVIDPHIWLDISLWKEIIDPITEALSEKDPVHSQLYHRNAESLKEEFLQRHEEILEKLYQVKEETRYLVTSHDGFSYFVRGYLSTDKDENWHERCMAPEGLAPEGQLSLHDIERVVRYILTWNIQVIFQESNVNVDALRKIADACKKQGKEIRISKKPLFGDTMQESKAGYIGMIEHNAEVLFQEWNLSDG